MGNSIINWIEQWLTDRRQRVVVDGEVSSWKSVLSGVPQGSVLGPILFLVYINDLEDGVAGSILKFADGTKLFRKTKEIGDKHNLQDDIDKLVRWSEKWQMLFNRSLSCFMFNAGNANQLKHLTALVETMLEKQQIRDRRLLTLMEKVIESQINQEKRLKLLVAKTTGAAVEEVVMPEGLKFPLENWDEFQEREHHLSSPQLGELG